MGLLAGLRRERMKHVLVQPLLRWSIDWQQAGPFYLANDRALGFLKGMPPHDI